MIKISFCTIFLAAASLHGAEILDLSANNSASLTVNGTGQVTSWTNTAGGQLFTSEAGDQPTLVTGVTPNGGSAVLFNGTSDVLRSVGFGETANDLTLFLVVAPLSNSGTYRAFVSGVDSSTPGHQDYSSGINVDMGSGGSTAFSTLNVEGAKAGGGGGTNLKTTSDPFGQFEVLSITYGSDQQDYLYENGSQQGGRYGSGNTVSLQDMRVGARYYDNGGGPYESGFLDGYIADVQIYNTVLSDSDRQAVEQALTDEYIAPIAPASTVPEPAGYALICLGLGGLLALVLRRRPIIQRS
jgi:hypothetical protein